MCICRTSGIAAVGAYHLSMSLGIGVFPMLGLDIIEARQSMLLEFFRKDIVGKAVLYLLCNPSEL